MFIALVGGSRHLVTGQPGLKRRADRVSEMKPGSSGPNLGLCVTCLAGKAVSPINGVQGETLVWEMSDFMDWKVGRFKMSIVSFC